MILHELKALALREHLVDDPAMQSKEVRWIIVLDDDGNYLSLRDTQQDVPLPEGKKGKPKRQLAMMAIPRRPVGKTAQNLASHLVDTLEYVVCLPAESAKKTPEQMLDRASKRHALYVEDLTQTSPNQTENEVEMILKFLSNADDLEICRNQLNEKEATSGDLATFRIGSQLLHESPALLQAWRDKNLPMRVADVETSFGQCLVCGQSNGEIARLHEGVKIPGGFGGGIPIVSANKEAFLKYNLEHTAPVCKTCMTSYVEGFRRLLHSRYISGHTHEAVVPHNAPLSADTTAVYWANVESDLTEVLVDLMYSPQKVKDLLSSPHRGIRPSGTQGRFFCLIVGGAEGRAMMHSVHTGTLDAVEANLKTYFDAITVEGANRQPLPLIRILLSTIAPDPQRKGDRPTKKEWEKRLQPGVIGKIWLSTLFGDPLPRSVLAGAVTRNKVERYVTDERAALLQLFFVSHKQKEVPQMSLDTESKDAPYRLGRLLSAYEQLQYSAHQVRSPGSKLNRTLVDRCFGAASTRPGVVFAQLARLSQSHVGILRRYGRAPDKNITEICDGFDGISFPSMLTLEEQGRFALGYYHQRQFFFPSHKENEQTTEETASTTEGETNA